MTVDERIRWIQSKGYHVLGRTFGNTHRHEPDVISVARKLRRGIMLLAIQPDGDYRELDYAPFREPDSGELESESDPRGLCQ